MSNKVEFSTLAFSKVFMHAMKYPHAAVSGVLLSSTSGGSVSQAVVDAVPLFHCTPLGLAPMLEAGLTQIDAFCQQAELAITGYYFAHENISDSQVSPVAMKIMENLSDDVSEAVLCVVDNRDLSPSALKLYRYAGGQLLRTSFAWKNNRRGKAATLASDEGDSKGLDAAASVVPMLLDSKLYRNIVDFDAHLDDLSKHWTNRSLNQQLEELFELYN